MSIEEYIKTSREKQRQKFGNVGLKKDCIHYATRILNGKKRCLSLNHDYRRGERLQCECDICQFYCPGERKGVKWQ